MAFGSVHDILLRVLGDPDDAQRAIEELAAQLAVFSKITAEAEADVLTEQATQKLRLLRARLEEIDLSSADVRVQADVAQAMVELEAVELKVNDIDGRTAHVDVDVRRGVLERINAVTNSVLRLGERIKTATSGNQGWIESLSGLRFSLGPIAGRLDVMAGVVGVLIPLIVSLTAAIVALAASLGAAIGGLGALAIAAGGALMPAIGLVIAGIQRFQATSGQAGSAAHALAQAFSGISDAAKALLPAADPALRALATGISNLKPLIEAVKPAFMDFGAAAGGALRALVDILSSPAIVAGVANMTRLSGGVLRPLAVIAGQVFRIFLNIAQAAMPLLVQGLQNVADGLKRFGDATSNISRLRGVIGALVSNLSSWLNLLGQIGRVFIELGRIAAPFGQAMVDSFAQAAKGIADWLHSAEGTKRVQQFFADVLPLAQALIDVAAQLVVTFLEVGQALAPVLTPTVQIIAQLIGYVNMLLEAFNSLPAPIRTAFIGGLAIAIAFLTGVGEIAAAILLVVGAIAVLKTAISALGGAFSAIGSAASAAFQAAAGAVASAATSLFGIVKGIFSKAINFVISIPRTAIGLASGLWSAVSGIIKRGISFLINLPRTAVGLASSLWSAVNGIIRRSISFVFSVPRTAIGLASSLWSAVSGIIRRAISFVIHMPAVGGLVSAAHSIWNAVKAALPDITIHIHIPTPSIPHINLPGGSLYPAAAVGEAIGKLINEGIAESLTPIVPTVRVPTVASAAAVAAGEAGAGGALNQFNITTPDGELPDVETMLAQIDAKLRARESW